ncbi:DUF3017 domain-containing protein [Streptomyces sp. NPDC046939]|uniref:DUF3017 domain-containing protein n=1 Tax=Streptomyces sp. NPDC046939 TaxID=3155376 RepID=UPI0033EB7A62
MGAGVSGAGVSGAEVSRAGVSGAEASGADGTGAGTGTGAGDSGAKGFGAFSARKRRGTRRFPLWTRDTARPEGGGRAASADAPVPARQWPLIAVLVVTGLGLLLTAFGLFRVGTILVGVALLGGAALRWALPSVGMLAVRSRFTDMITYGVLGLAIVLLAMMAQPSPWLKIPFLQDTLHFTLR